MILSLTCSFRTFLSGNPNLLWKGVEICQNILRKISKGLSIFFAGVVFVKNFIAIYSDLMCPLRNVFSYFPIFGKFIYALFELPWCSIRIFGEVFGSYIYSLSKHRASPIIGYANYLAPLAERFCNIIRKVIWNINWIWFWEPLTYLLRTIAYQFAISQKIKYCWIWGLVQLKLNFNLANNSFPALIACCKKLIPVIKDSFCVKYWILKFNSKSRVICYAIGALMGKNCHD